MCRSDSRPNVPIDTPIFELKETLLGKYGDNQKLIFDLNDQGGEQLSLRYDLTIPFARYAATHSLEKIKRYHIGKVYRRDEPQVHHGRFREFYQCDLDIAGNYDLMVPDVEVLCVLWDILNEFKESIGDFIIKVNHRKLLDAILDICGINEDNFKSVCSSIDKIDKIGWKGVQEELVTSKNISFTVTESLEKFIKIHGSFHHVMEEIQNMVDLKNHSLAIKAIEELKLIETYLLDTHCLVNFQLDLSLARGLDYYTGMIFEATVPAHPWIGSVGAGGRYDGLLGLFSAKQIPSVGVSVGLERLFRLLEYSLETKGILKQRAPTLNKKQSTLGKLFETHVDVLVCSVGANLQRQKINVCKQLRNAGICADFIYTNKMKLGKQLQQANDMGVELVIVIGEEEIKENVVMLKRFNYMDDSESNESRQVTDIQVPLGDLVKTIETYLHTTCATRMEHVILGK